MLPCFITRCLQKWPERPGNSPASKIEKDVRAGWYSKLYENIIATYSFKYTKLTQFTQRWMRLKGWWRILWPGNSFGRGWISTVDLIVLTSIYQMFLILNFFLIYKTSYLNEEVNWCKPCFGFQTITREGIYWAFLLSICLWAGCTLHMKCHLLPRESPLNRDQRNNVTVQTT